MYQHRAEFYAPLDGEDDDFINTDLNSSIINGYTNFYFVAIHSYITLTKFILLVVIKR